jgi:hypothetical protein
MLFELLIAARTMPSVLSRRVKARAETAGDGKSRLIDPTKAVVILESRRNEPWHENEGRLPGCAPRRGANGSSFIAAAALLRFAV